MALAKNVMGAGFSSSQARALNGNSTNSTVTAAGTTQATATAITADVNVVTTATTGQGVILYAGVGGDSQVVYNSTTADIKVYPPTGVAINQLAANSGFILAPRTACEVQLMTATAAVAFLSA